jgi:hypothetical protein
MYDGYVDFILDLSARPCQSMGLRDGRLWRDTLHRPRIPTRPSRRQLFDTLNIDQIKGQNPRAERACVSSVSGEAQLSCSLSC